MNEPRGTPAARRVLVISYAFPPLVNAQAIRWLMLVRQLAARRTTVDVLTVRLPAYYEDLLDEIPTGVRIHRAPAGPLERIALGAKARLRTDDAWLAARHRGGATGIGRRAYNLIRRAANAAMVTDACTEWFPFAAPRALALVREQRPDVVVSSFEPGVSHLLGWLLRRRTGLPWVADFGDPWVNQNTPAWRRGVDAWIERRLFANVDAACVTTERLAAAYEKQYPHLGRVHVVPQGFDPDLFAGVQSERLADTNVLNVVHTGTLYQELRPPAPVFAALCRLHDRGVRAALVLAGRAPGSMVEEVRQNDALRGAVRFLGVVPHKRALALQKGADVLLHLENRGAALQMPGKFYEYLGAGRPILVVRHDEPGESPAARSVRSGGFGRDVPADPEAIADALEAFHRDRHNLSRWQPPPDLVARHTYARSADMLCTAIEEAIAASTRVKS